MASKKITESGPIGLRGVRGTDLYNNLTIASASGDADAAAMLAGLSASKPTPYNFGDVSQYYNPTQDSYDSPWRDLGNSVYDEPYIMGDDPTDIAENRAVNQSWGAKWGAGLGKGITLAATTLLDGTIGLLYGTARSIYNVFDQDPNTARDGFIGGLSYLWDNEVSNAFQEINQKAEEYMPNYKSREEQENAWYQNMGTANFWADGVLKNLGFMVGAVYSGAAWTKGLNMLGKAVKLGEMSTMGTRIIGSVLSATNEARIEANQNSADWEKLEMQKLRDAYTQSTGIDDPDLMQRDPNYQRMVADIQDRKAKVGAVDFFSNLPLLAFDDFMMYGKLYSRGFSNAREIASSIEKTGEKSGNWLSRGWGRLKNAGQEGLKAEAKEAANIAMENGKYVAKKMTAKDTWGSILKTAIREGNEEMAQQMAANLAGDLYETDSPDAYIHALNNPSAQIKANDFMQSLTKAFADSYGNGDQWEQFAVGAISSMIGMPTFGRVNNSDANTVLGKGKMVGWSGGILGEISSNRAANQEAQRNVDAMNKVVDRINEKKRHYAMSNSFTDAMDGFSEEGDKFEYKNAEDNLDFASIQAFSNAGRMEDLKGLVNQDFDNMSAEELGKIAMFTSKKDAEGKPVGGWQTKDGKPMATINEEDGTIEMSEENQAEMREALNEKKERILKQIEDYGKAIQTVRAIGNNSLTDEQNQELAWLLWKQNQFSDRFNSVKKENAESFEGLLSGLKHWEDALTEERKNLVQDTKIAEKDIYETNEQGERVLVAKKGDIIEDTEGANSKILRENTGMLSNVRAAKALIEQIQSSESPLYLASYLKANPEFSKLIRSEDFFNFVEALSTHSGMDFAKYSKAMQDLIDSERLAKASETFNERYKEFVTNPMSVIAGRENTATQNEAKTTASSKVNKRDDINNASVSDLVEQAEAGANLDEMESMFDSINEGGAPTDASEAATWQQEGKKKVQAAKEIIDTKNKTAAQLGTLLANGSITQQQYDDAMTLLNNASHTSNNVDEMTDLSSFSLNDAQSLEVGTLDQSITPEELDDFMNNRVDEAKNALSEVFATMKQAKEDTSDIPDPVADEMASTLNADNSGEDLAGAKEEAAKKTTINPTDTTAPKTKEAPAATKEDTGHDATPKVTSENEKQKEKEEKAKEEKIAVEEGPQGLANTIANAITEGMPEQMATATNQMIASDLGNIAQELHSLKQSGVSAVEAIHSIKDSAPMQRLAQMLGGNTQKVEQAINSWWTKAPQVVKEDLGVESDEPTVATTDGPTDTQAALDTAKAVEQTNNSIAGSLQYWKPTTTEVPIGWVRGEQIPFWQQAQAMKNADGTAKYTPAQIARFKALYEYMQNHNVWNNAFNANEGDVVNFVIDPSLNTNAGETVILMSINGKIVGDVMSSNDMSFNRQTGLVDFVNIVTQEYSDWVSAGNTGIFTSKETSKVSKKMVGKVPYAEPNSRKTLNEIHTTTDSTSADTNVPFKLGIQVNEGGNRILMTPGRTRRQGASTEEGTIIPSLSARAGQPFLLMPTGSSKRAFIPVPITMPRYSADTTNSKLGKEIDKVLQKLTTIKKGQETAIIRELQELLCIPKMHLNILDDGRIKFTMVAVNDTAQTTLYEGQPTTAGMVDKIKAKLYNNPFQISRKYINTTFKDGTDYNSMIGELATCNLPVGATHTISSWLTINPVTSEGQQRAKSPKSIKYNPSATSKEFTQYTYSSASGTHVVAINNQTYDIYLWNATEKKWEAKPNAKDAKATAFKAQTYINNNHITPNNDGLVKTPWGTYNVNTGVFVNAQVSNTDAISHTPKAPTTEDKNSGQVKFTFGQSGQVQTAQPKTTIPAKLEDRISIHGSTGLLNPNMGAGDTHHFGNTKMNPADARIKGRNVVNHANPVAFADASTVYIYESNSRGRLFSGSARGDVESIKFYRPLTEDEQSRVIEYLTSIRDGKTAINNFKTLAESLDAILNNSSRPTLSPTAKMVLHELQPYFEGGGRWVTDDYPLVEEELADKAANAALIDEILSEEDANKLLQQMRQSRIKVALDSINKTWDTIKTERASQITKENEEFFINTVNDEFVSLIGTQAAEELAKICKSAKSKEEIKTAMSKHPVLSTIIPLYDRVDDIVREYQSIVDGKQEPAPTKTDADYDREAISKGLLTTNATKQMWKALSTEHKAAILALPKMKAKPIINNLARNFNVKNNEFTADVNQIISGTRNREESKETVKPIDINKESKWLAKVLPTLVLGDRVRVVNGLIKLSDKHNGTKAWGQFKNGVITISSQAARGTMYHEAFHAVVNTLLSDTELDTLFKEAAKQYSKNNTIALEEQLAEDFRKYVQFEETPILGTAVKLFRTLKHVIKSLRGRETYIENLFYRIQRGKLANANTHTSKVTRNRVSSTRTTYDIQNEINDFKQQYEKATSIRVALKNYRGIFRQDALKYAESLGLSDTTYTFQLAGRWTVSPISRAEYQARLNSLNRELELTMDSEIDSTERLSRQALEEQEWEREFEEYYNEKYMYDNLDSEDREYIKDRGISIEDYSKMTPQEQETLMHCKL